MSIRGWSTWLLRMRFAMVSRRHSSVGEGVVARGILALRGLGGQVGCGGCGAEKGREGQNGPMISTVPPTPLSAEAELNQFRLHQADWRRRFHVVELGLFGSVARGEARPDSDLDVWVQLDPLTPYALVHLKQELEELLQRPVDLVRLRDRMAPTLRQRIESEGLKA